MKWKHKYSQLQLCYGGGLVAKSCLTLATCWTVACQAPLSMVYPRQKYRSRLPFLFPGDLLDPGIEPVSLALQVDSFAIKPPEKLHSQLWKILILTSLSTNKVKGLKCHIAITTKYTIISCKKMLSGSF